MPTNDGPHLCLVACRCERCHKASAPAKVFLAEVSSLPSVNLAVRTYGMTAVQQSFVDIEEVGVMGSRLHALLH
jgi:hypothetical protein